MCRRWVRRARGLPWGRDRGGRRARRPSPSPCACARCGARDMRPAERMPRGCGPARRSGCDRAGALAPMSRARLSCGACPTCLVTGGAGFLGSHLCDELLARGQRVICVDNFETGSLRNIEHIRDPERFVHLGVDIIDPYYVDEPIDYVYHLASPASPIDYLRLPLHTLKVGSYGTHHTLGLAKAHRARFLDRLHERGVRRSAGASAVGELLGPRQSDRPARGLRRGQALRGGADDGLPPPAGRGHGDRTDLQHLRLRACARTTAARSRRSCARRWRTGR